MIGLYILCYLFSIFAYMVVFCLALFYGVKPYITFQRRISRVNLSCTKMLDYEKEGSQWEFHQISRCA